MDRFDSRYPALANLLGAYFPDADLDGRTTDEAIVAFFRSVTRPEEQQAAAREAQQVLALPAVPRRELARLANRHLADDAAAKAWLERLVALLQAPGR